MLESFPALSFPRKRESRLFLGFLDARLRGHDEWVEGVVVLTMEPLEYRLSPCFSLISSRPR